MMVLFSLAAGPRRWTNTTEQKPDGARLLPFPRFNEVIPVLSRVHRKTRHKKETLAEAKTREKPE